MALLAAAGAGCAGAAASTTGPLIGGRCVVETAASGSEFDVRGLRIDGSGATTYGRVPGCFDEGAYVAALQSLQFVPGRKSLVFESYCPEPPSGLFAVSPDGAALAKLTGGGKQFLAPSWSPDGTHLAYTRFDHTGLSCKGCPGSIWSGPMSIAGVSSLCRTEPSIAAT